uniref:Iron complex transport system substrate-binding protein n=1 Tax=Candidatus Kentrum sp. FM TaxID=2126340 RepID=A0A450SY09_9GAMM|nr:MAG: iron complex transport system substrate-binding protein [Candidatus Kentron sp. FM]VFJ62321.1 MAG: iron complex transport system substrate-binding protein [Candidatus Kentron sp. FM]VFK13236.1 MAG: iron complex transport system substrate-binding protein [Candidatus Kentron sp. FM]
MPQQKLRAIKTILFALCLSAYLLPFRAAAAETAPHRLVSLNTCTDQLLLMLARRERIAALTYLATRQEVSSLWREARGIPQVRGSAEEILMLQPDLVLAGIYTTRYTIELLRQFRVPVISLPPANDFADVRRQIRQVAEAIGEEKRGEALVAAFDQDLARLSTTRPRSGVFYRNGGYSVGRGTLSDAVMRAANMENAAAIAGLEGSGFLPLEQLVMARPDWLITSDYQHGVPTLGSRSLRHPVLRALPGGEFILPGNLTACGGPWNTRAVELLAGLPPVD